MKIDPTDLPFLVEMMNKARFYNDKENAYGSRRLIIDSRSGVRPAHRLGTLAGGLVPHPSAGRWRLRIRGYAAESLLTQALPHMSSPKRERAAEALALIHAGETPREEAA